MNVILKLTRPAAKAGGDRYETDLVGESKPWVVYVPQTISRPNGDPIATLNVAVKPGS